jgi:hypothetical protein
MPQYRETVPGIHRQVSAEKDVCPTCEGPLRASRLPGPSPIYVVMRCPWCRVVNHIGCMPRRHGSHGQRVCKNCREGDD